MGIVGGATKGDPPQSAPSINVHMDIDIIVASDTLDV